MPKLLILAGSEAEAVKLERTGADRGFRVKSTSDLKTAYHWAEQFAFDAAFVNARIAIGNQQELAAFIWAKSPGARFVVYDLDLGSTIDRNELRLYGAELVKGAAALEELDHVLTSLSPGNTPESGEFRVMVVEDLDSPRDIICFFVESLGFSNVEGKASAREAMQELEADPRRFGCVITDIRMPEISGKELIDHIRAHAKLRHLPVIVLTAHGTVDCLVDCLRAGASGFLVKPPRKQDLTRELSRALRIAAGQDSPRLCAPNEAESVRELLIKKGIAI